MSINIKDIEDIIKNHMNEQPYEIKCSECGRDLNFDRKLDLDQDLTIEVYPCDCLKGS